MSNKKPPVKKPASAPALKKSLEPAAPAPSPAQAAKAGNAPKSMEAEKAAKAAKAAKAVKGKTPTSVRRAPAPGAAPALPAAVVEAPRAAARKRASRKTAAEAPPGSASRAPRPGRATAAPAPAPRRAAARSRAPAAEAPPDIAVYQIFFEAAQRAKLDPAFIPLDNSGRREPLLEFAVFERLAADEGVRLAPLWGAVSWRFGQKSGLSGKDYLDAVRRNPGHDLYFCNPSPENEGLYANGWQQGITAHPAFREACEAVFKAAGLDPAALDAVTPSQLTSSCNYFVGSERFWNAYLAFVRGVVARARARLPAATVAVLDSNRGDPRGLHAGATYWPFIVERLLPVFLRGPGADLKVFKIPLPAAESRLNSHIQRLREMKDVAHRTRSQWLVSCWVHYRNLFLLQAAGREWCKQYLPLITPKSVDFL